MSVYESEPTVTGLQATLHKKTSKTQRIWRGLVLNDHVCNQEVVMANPTALFLVRWNPKVQALVSLKRIVRFTLCIHTDHTLSPDTIMTVDAYDKPDLWYKEREWKGTFEEIYERQRARSIH